MSLYHVSGRAYRLLSKFFYLPSKRSLHRWVSRLPRTPGITEAAMNVIETKVKVMNSISKICSICIDEMSLKTNLIYNISADEVLGFVDLGASKKFELIATSALVVMACGMADKWKQPLGYFLVHESCKSIDVKRTVAKPARCVWSCKYRPKRRRRKANASAGGLGVLPRKILKLKHPESPFAAI